MRITKPLVSAILILMFLGTVFAASNIGVMVNGESVQFRGVQPQMVGGRVLVPLRGVFEKMNAFVGWDSATRTVMIQTGDKDIMIPAGSKTASVNGNILYMDTPVLIMNGTTMVPLRFVGETLGADVKWNSATKTVEISTDGGAVPTPAEPVPQTVPVTITSFYHNANDWLKAGEELVITMTGSSGGNASFEIPGIASQLPMKEVSSGKYEARWTVTSKTPVASEAAIIGRLNGQLIQAGNTVKIDGVAPVIKDLDPQADSIITQNRPNISATFSDASGSGIDPNSIKMLLNGEDITKNVNATQAFVSYRPDNLLPAGVNTIELSLTDRAGNKAVSTWKFNLREAASIIKSVAYNAPENAGPGDVITVTIEGEEKNTAKFWFVSSAGNKLTEQPMRETSPGVYTGEYTIRRSDNLNNASVVGAITTASDSVYTLTADKKIGGQSAALTKPKITNPAADSSVASPVTIKGTADPGSTIQVKITYTSVLLGALETSGTLSEQTLTTGENGVFTSAPVALSALLGGKTEYKITAAMIGVNGEVSDSDVVVFMKK
jgi:hypothetical protein